MKISAIDVFCGIGGLSYGLKRAGINVLAGIDLDEKCRYAYEKNVGSEFILNDISKIQGGDLIERYWTDNDQIKILAGCAPCQPFSNHTNKIKNRKQEEKWRLISEFTRLADEIRPDIVTMENVPNLAKQEIFTDLVLFLERNGYYVSYSNVYCPDYGIPQTRTRLVLLASRFGEIELVPKTTEKDDYSTVKETIGDLEQICAGQTSNKDPLHRACSFTDINMDRIKQSRPGGSWRDWDESLLLPCHKKDTGKTYPSVYGRMCWDEPSPTITTQFYNYGTGRFGHPEQDRALSLREGALLQTFPLRYEFIDPINDGMSIKRIGIHIGNAVPVKLAEIIGKSIIRNIESNHGTRWSLHFRNFIKRLKSFR